MAVFRGALIEDASAEFRRQHQKLRRLAAELLAEFRGQARKSSMIAHSKTVLISIYRFINVILTRVIILFHGNVSANTTHTTNAVI